MSNLNLIIKMNLNVAGVLFSPREILTSHLGYYDITVPWWCSRRALRRSYRQKCRKDQHVLCCVLLWMYRKLVSYFDNSQSVNINL